MQGVNSINQFEKEKHLASTTNISLRNAIQKDRKEECRVRSTMFKDGI